MSPGTLGHLVTGAVFGVLALITGYGAWTDRQERRTTAAADALHTARTARIDTACHRIQDHQQIGQTRKTP